MKRILLSSLMSCLAFSQAQCGIKEFAAGFLSSALVQVSVAGLNYAAAPVCRNAIKVAVDATHQSSMLTLTTGGLLMAVHSLNRVDQNHVARRSEQERVMSAALGVVCGSLVGFAGCCAAWYAHKI